MSQKEFKRKLGSILIIIILICSGLLIILPTNPIFKTSRANSNWVQTSAKHFNNGTLNNLTMVGTGKDTALKIDFTDLDTWTKKTPVLRPPVGYYPAMASIHGDDKVLHFGGSWYYGGYYYYNETWVYDLSDNTWARKFPTTRPKSRYYQKMAPIYGDDKVVLFGGFSRPSYVNDTWIYDLSNNTWMEMFPKNSPLRGYYNSMVSIYGDDKVVLYGGNYYANYFNETWVYDLSNNTWEKKDPMNSPGNRYGASMASIHGDDKVILFGGRYGNLLYDTWVYDLSADNWIEKHPLTTPTPRTYQAMTSIHGTDQVVLHGGWYSYYDDTWVYDLSKNEWALKTLTNEPEKPSGRYYHGFATVYGTDKAVLYGGQSDKGWLTDTWIYKHFLTTRNGTYISGPYDTVCTPSFKTINWYGVTPANTSIKFQLRSAANLSILYNKSFVGPNGKTSRYYTSPPSNIWVGHNRDRWIQYIAYLNISIYPVNSPSLEDVTVSYNCLPSTIVISPINGSILANNKPVFIWTFDDYDSNQQKAFQVLIDDDIKFESIDYNSGEQSTEQQRWVFPTGKNYTELPDGRWYWEVRTKDEDGAWTDYSIPWELTIDTHAPRSSPTVPINNGFYNSLDTISGIATDSAPGSGVNNIEISIRSLSYNHYWNGSTWVPMLTWLPVTGTMIWSYDSSTVKWISGNRYSIQSRATDNATNFETPSISNVFTIDKDNPSSIIDIPMNNIWLNKLNIISGTSTDIGGSGTVRVEISIYSFEDNKYWAVKGWESIESWLPAIGTYKWYYNSSKVPWFSGDQYLIRSLATDNASNVEDPSEGNYFKYDDQPPEPLSIDINDGDEYTKSANVILSLHSEDSDSGISQMSFSFDDMDWTSWEPFDQKRPITLPPNDGEKSVYYRVLDNASNIADPVFDTIIYDATPPENLSIVVNNNANYTNSAQVKLNLYATDMLSGVADMSLNYDTTSWTIWKTFNHEMFFTLPPNDGEKIIYFRVRDKVSNIAEPIFSSITLDTEPPHSLSISINNGAFETDSELVTLKLNAIDNISGTHQMSFSIDGMNWTSWEPFNHERFFTLPPNDGEKSIYFRVMDRAGNIADPISNVILLKTPQPTKLDNTEKRSLLSTEFLIILIVFIIIILILILVGIIKKRRKHPRQELLPAGALTIKPGALSTPVISIGQVPGTLKVPRLPSTIPAVSSQQPTPTIAPTPILAKSTQIPQTPIPQPTAQVPQLPQLPPAQNQALTTSITEITSTPSASPQTTISPAPSVSTQTTTPTPTIAQPSTPSPSPDVHLPASTAQPTIAGTGQPTLLVDKTAKAQQVIGTTPTAVQTQSQPPSLSQESTGKTDEDQNKDPEL